MGRAATRDRLHGDPDSTLADFGAAFAADSTRIDALFERARLNERLGRRSAAVDDLQHFLSLATNPNDREAAQTRLRALAPKDTTARTPPTRVAETQVVVYIQYTDPSDSTAVEQIRHDLGHVKGFKVPSAEFRRDSLSVPEVRYYPSDERYIKDLLIITEGALAKAGYRLHLQPRPLDPKRYPRARGRLEVWLPSLARTLYSTPVQRY
jgi:hypothetical protein